MTEADQPARYSTKGCRDFSPGGQTDPWSPRWLAKDLDIQPGNFIRKAGPKCLGYCFLGCVPAGIILHLGWWLICFSLFRVCEYAVKPVLSWIGQEFFDPFQFLNVDTMADNPVWSKNSADQ